VPGTRRGADSNFHNYTTLFSTGIYVVRLSDEGNNMSETDSGDLMTTATQSVYSRLTLITGQ
jgi:hypothetical protein